MVPSVPIFDNFLSGTSLQLSKDQLKFIYDIIPFKNTTRAFNNGNKAQFNEAVNGKSKILILCKSSPDNIFGAFTDSEINLRLSKDTSFSMTRCSVIFNLSLKKLCPFRLNKGD